MHKKILSFPRRKTVKITIDINQPLFKVNNNYLSVAVDISKALGGHWWNSSGSVEMKLGKHKTLPLDLTNKKLIALTSALAPAYLRIGGTEADKTLFGETDTNKDSITLTTRLWDGINEFVKKVKMNLFFTVNAGTMVRDKHHKWHSTNLEKLLIYSKKKKYRIDAFELGNEVNAYWFFYGLRNRVSIRQYKADFEKFRNIVKKYYPNTKVGGAGTMYWPKLGEVFSFVGNIESSLIKDRKVQADMFTWHYYPQQSQRSLIPFFKAKSGALLNPNYLNDIGIWAKQLNILKQKYHPHGQVWIGEIGHALCGGQPGLSNTFESSFWWTDVLGFSAINKQSVVIRQDLIGADYGLLDEQTCDPLPDYWTSLLWKKLMGTQVFRVTISDENPYIRVYAHNTNLKYHKSAVTIVLINLQNQNNSVRCNYLKTNKVRIFQLSAKNISDKTILLNNKPLTLVDNEIPQIEGEDIEIANNNIIIQPFSITYLVVPNL